jgi:hypothetical protein
MLDLVPPEIRTAYELDELFIGDATDGARWLAGAYLEWRFGPHLADGWRDQVLGVTHIGYFGQTI